MPTITVTKNPKYNPNCNLKLYRNVSMNKKKASQFYFYIPFESLSVYLLLIMLTLSLKSSSQCFPPIHMAIEVQPFSDLSED